MNHKDADLVEQLGRHLVGEQKKHRTYRGQITECPLCLAVNRKANAEGCSKCICGEYMVTNYGKRSQRFACVDMMLLTHGGHEEHPAGATRFTWRAVWRAYAVLVQFLEDREEPHAGHGPFPAYTNVNC